MYVVWYQQRYQDSTETNSEIVTTIEDGIQFINRMIKRYDSQNTIYKLYEVGKEIPLVVQEVEIPQPPVVETQYVRRTEKRRKK